MDEMKMDEENEKNARKLYEKILQKIDHLKFLTESSI